MLERLLIGAVNGFDINFKERAGDRVAFDLADAARLRRYAGKTASVDSFLSRIGHFQLPHWSSWAGGRLCHVSR
jgi:hypothetical protein